ncbi:MAG: 3-phosphoshikimate 1-carboxyvinyltransferase [Oscillospiraceae bacterium]
MNVTISPHPLAGTIPAIPSKSQAHRLLICAAFADRETEIACPALSKDIEATAACLSALGAGIRYADGVYTVRPVEAPAKEPVLDCGESGSTLRFLLPVVCALGVPARLKMHGRLPQRPLSPLWEELEAHGSELSRPAEDVIAVAGRLRPGAYRIDAGVSSQFISGLLFALPLLEGASSLSLTGRIESAGYIDMTLRALAAFGAAPMGEGRSYTVPAGTKYVSPGAARVEGDWSNAAFWVAADHLSSGTVTCTGLDPASAQGDRAVVEAAASIAAGNAVIDARNIPDLVPVLAVLAAVSPGTTEFVNAARLRIKESDRLTAVTEMLTALGGDVTERPDGLSIRGRKRLRGGVVNSVGDHRIAMSAAVAAIACEGPVTVLGAECVSKSYPAFWRDYAALGGQIQEE